MLMGVALSSAMNPNIIHKGPKKFGESFTDRNTASLICKGQRQYRIKREIWILNHFTYRKQTDKIA